MSAPCSPQGAGRRPVLLTLAAAPSGRAADAPRTRQADLGGRHPDWNITHPRPRQQPAARQRNAGPRRCDLRAGKCAGCHGEGARGGSVQDALVGGDSIVAGRHRGGKDHRQFLGPTRPRCSITSGAPCRGRSPLPIERGSLFPVHTALLAQQQSSSARTTPWTRTDACPK